MRLISAGVAAGLVCPVAAEAFCGLYVTEPGKTVENTASQVIWAHHDGRTTITIGADFTGDASSFGLLVPVPSSLVEADVTVEQPALFDYLAQYTTPRLVRYECEDFRYYDYDDDGMADADVEESDTTGPPAEVVEVEALFTVGEYEVAILDTSDAAALTAWLSTHGYAAPDDQNGILQGYLDSGTNFLAARVLLDAIPEGQQWLSPLRFTYETSSFWLPIRIGTLASGGEAQETIVYAITDEDVGELHIAGYPRVIVEDECMWDPEPDQTLDQFYGAELDAAFGGEAGWLVEYSIPVIGQAQCDPCTADSPLFIEDLAAYGWDGATYSYYDGYFSGSAHLTRLRVRYTPEQAVRDLEFERGGEQYMSQIRYIEYLPELEDRYPVCGVGMVPEPGSCEDPGPGYENVDPTDAEEEGVRGVGGGSGCDTSGVRLVWTAMFVGLLTRARRR